MTTADALRFATFRIFSLNVQFPEATSATQAVLGATGGNLTCGSHACLSCGKLGTRTRPLISLLGECSPYRPHSVFSILTSELTGSRYVMLTKAVYHSSFSATVKSRHSKWTKLNDSSHVERARLRQARTTDGAIVIVGLAQACRWAPGLLLSGIFQTFPSFYWTNGWKRLAFMLFSDSHWRSGPRLDAAKGTEQAPPAEDGPSLLLLRWLFPCPHLRLAPRPLSRDLGGAKPSDVPWHKGGGGF